jgi:hypothetical protein
MYVVGNLYHAAQECYSEYKELAMVLREHRIAYMEEPAHIVPFESLYAFVNTCIQIQAGANAPFSYPVIPDNCLQGLSTDKDGRPIFSGDTRP